MSLCLYQIDQAKGTSDYVEKRGQPIPLRKEEFDVYRCNLESW